MTDLPRFAVNRSIIILRYKKPFVDWVNSIAATHRKFTAEEIEDSGEAFMIPALETVEIVDTTEDAVNWVEKRWRMFFEHELNAWVTDEATWPHDLSLDLFREWFNIEFRPIVWDLLSEPLLVGELTDEDDEGEVDKTIH